MQVMESSSSINVTEHEESSVSTEIFALNELYLRSYENCDRSGKQFLQKILNWKRDDIFNDKLLLHHLNTLPKIYDSSIQWFDSFYWFVAEEMRCQLKGVMEKCISEFDSFAIAKISKCNKECKGSITFVVSDVQQQYKLQDVICTVILLVKKSSLKDSHPSSSLFSLLNDTHTLLSVEFPSDDAKESRGGEKEISLPLTFNVECPQGFSTSDMENWTAISLCVATTTSVRLADALVRKETPTFMTHILTGKPTYSEGYKMNVLGFRETSLPFTTDLNESQKIAVEQILSVGDGLISPIQIVKGPPGLIL